MVLLDSAPPLPSASSHLLSVLAFPSAVPVPLPLSSPLGFLPPLLMSRLVSALPLRGVRLLLARVAPFFYFGGTSGSSESCDDTFLYRGFDDFLVKGGKESPALGKADFSRAFHEVVSLIMSFFSHAIPSSSSFSVESYPWMNVLVLLIVATCVTFSLSLTSCRQCQRRGMRSSEKPQTTKRRL